MSEVVNRQVNIFIESGNAQAALDVLLTKQKSLTDEITRTSDPKRLKSLNDDLTKLSEPIDRATKKLSGELSPTFKDVQKAVNDLGNRLKKMSEQDADYSKVISQYKQANVELDAQREKLGFIKKGHEEAGSSFEKIFERVAEYTLAYELIGKAVESVKEFFKGSIEEADKAEAATTKLRNSLQNVGRIDLFGSLAEEAEKFANAYQRINPNDIKDVFTKLIDYGKLTKEQITSLTDVIINYAAKQNVSIQDATDVFTRALEGNAKGLRNYGISIAGAHTVTERYGIIVGQMADKLKGSEAALENTNKGFRDVWIETLHRGQEVIGNFIYKLSGLDDIQQRNAVTAKKEADQGAELVKRYEELSGKVNKTTAEKSELNSITNSLVSIFGTSVVSIDKETGALKLNVEATKDLIKQKLLLSNSRATELAAKAGQANDNENEQINNQKKLLPAIIDLEKKLGETMQDVIDKQNKIGNSGILGPNKELTDDEKKLFDLSIQFEEFIKSKKRFTSEKDDLLKQLNELGFKTEDVTKLLSPNTDPNAIIGGGNPDANEEAKRLAEEARKKLLEDTKKFYEDLAKLGREYSVTNQSQLDKEIEQTAEKFHALVELTHGNKDELKLLEEGFYKAVEQLRAKYAQKELDEFYKASNHFEEENRKFFENVIKDGEGAIKKFDALLKNGIDKQNKDTLAALQLKVLQAYGPEQLKAQKALLDEQERQELAVTGLTENEKSLIRGKYRKQEQELDLKAIDAYINYFQQVVGILNNIANAKTQQENNELARDQKLNDKKKQNLQERLKEGIISQQQYDQQVAELDKKSQDRQRQIAMQQFKRKQRQDEVQAGISGAQAVMKTLEEFGPPIPPNFLGIAAMALTVGTTIAEIAAITKEKPPEYARGGKLDGPSHANGGIPAVNSRGIKVAEVEGGEGIANKRTMGDRNHYSVSGTPSGIISLLNGLHGGVQWESGATIRPLWSSQRPAAINFSGLNSSFNQVRMFAAGGVISQAPSSLNQQSSPSFPSEMMVSVLQDMQITISNMQVTLASLQKNGIQAYVPITHFKDQETRYNNIIDDATMKP